MASSRIRYAADSASGGIQDRIRSLTEQIKAEPGNELPLLELAHLYAQVWIRSQQPEVLQRVVVCLDRAVDLEDGAYAPQLAKLLDGITRHVRDRGLAEPLARLEAIARQLAMWYATPPPAPAPPEPKPTAGPAPAPPTPPPAQDVSAPESESGNEPEIYTVAPEPQEEVEPEPPPPEEPRIEPMREALPPAGGPRTPRPSSHDMDVDVETVEETSAPDRRRFARDMAATGAASSRGVQQLFEEGRLNDILRAYTTLSDIRTKRRVIEGLVERIPQWRIEPVLAVGALETDEQLFRFIMRLLLRRDRTEICKQINLTAYSPDLQKVGVIVLSELGVRSALLKLEKALELNDPIVRTVAAHGIARAGKAAISHIPKLVDTVVSDPNLEVRRSAAKALNAMGVKEACQALEEAASKNRFDAEVYAELEAMRERYGSGHRSQDAEKKKSGGVSPQQKQNLVKAVVIVVVSLVALAFAWKQIKPWLPQPSPPATEETAPPAQQ